MVIRPSLTVVPILRVSPASVNAALPATWDRGRTGVFFATQRWIHAGGPLGRALDLVPG